VTDDPGLARVTFTFTVEQARVLAAAARYMAKKKKKEATRKPYIPLPGRFNLNERHGVLLTDAARNIQKTLDERHK
jgi:hypothetical protein